MRNKFYDVIVVQIAISWSHLKSYLVMSLMFGKFILIYLEIFKIFLANDLVNLPSFACIYSENKPGQKYIHTHTHETDNHSESFHIII